MNTCPPYLQEKIKELTADSVSRETFFRLEKYVLLLSQENKKYNLVGPKEMERLWERHVLDSAQLFPFLRGAESFLDVGSGAGFPGVVLSVLGVPGVLVEASQKKARFLKTVSRETGAHFFVLNERVEALREGCFDVVVARAVAPIGVLLEWTRGVVSFKTRFLFLKGKTFELEIENALKNFSFDVSVYPSLTSSEGRIVEIRNLKY